MADKNLHDIKIDELDNPKKTPLKNILTLLALLFIILVISVVITKLILNTDEGASIENNDSKAELLNDVNDTNKTATMLNMLGDDKKNALNKDNSIIDKDTLKDNIPVVSANITERNLTSAIKAPLSSHEPKGMRTYKAPKEDTTPKESRVAVKNTNVVKKAVVKKAVVKRNPTPAKKEYIDKVVVKKNTTSTSSSRTNASLSKTNSSFLGGKQKAVTHSYYIKVGTYRNAATVVSKVKRNNFNYALVKVENDKTLTRVLVGPFFSRNQANTQLAKVKANILSGAYVTKAK